MWSRALFSQMLLLGGNRDESYAHALARADSDDQRDDRAGHDEQHGRHDQKSGEQVPNGGVTVGAG